MSTHENSHSDLPPPREEVGYRQPPTIRRFKVCGNPKGRPKGSKNRKTIVRAVANEKHTVVENGKRRRRSTLELVLIRLRNMALERKNVRAFEEFHRVIKTYQPQNADGKHGVIVAPPDMTPEEWIAEQLEKNKTRERPSSCKKGDDQLGSP